MRLRDSLSWLAAPALLVGVAGYQYSQVIRHDQSTWIGVGFGMFATFEQGNTRFVALSIDLGGEQVEARIGDSEFRDQARQLTVRPAAGDVADLARDLLDERWHVDDDGIARLSPTGEPAGAVTVSVIGFELGGGTDDPHLSRTVVRTETATAP